MLRIYVADDCPGSSRARQLAARLSEQTLHVPVEIINVEAPGMPVSSTVFGTPTYTWNDRILFLGNPSEQELLERVRMLNEHTATSDVTG